MTERAAFGADIDIALERRRDQPYHPEADPRDPGETHAQCTTSSPSAVSIAESKRSRRGREALTDRPLTSSDAEAVLYLQRLVGNQGTARTVQRRKKTQGSNGHQYHVYDFDADDITGSHDPGQSKIVVGSGQGKLLADAATSSQADTAAVVDHAVGRIADIGVEVLARLPGDEAAGPSGWKAFLLQSGLLPGNVLNRKATDRLAEYYNPFVYAVKVTDQQRNLNLTFYVQFAQQYKGYVSEIVVDDGANESKFPMVPIDPKDVTFADLTAYAQNHASYGSGHDPHTGGTLIPESTNVLQQPGTATGSQADALAKVLAEGSRFRCVKRAYDLGILDDSTEFFTRFPQTVSLKHAKGPWIKVAIVVGMTFSQLWLEWNRMGAGYRIPNNEVADHVRKQFVLKRTDQQQALLDGAVQVLHGAPYVRNTRDKTVAYFVNQTQMNNVPANKGLDLDTNQAG